MQGTTAIKRSGYAITGQVLAFRVVSTPAGANDGLFYVFTDHLGSTSLLRKSGTTIPFAGSTTRYLPFGGYRTPPTQTLTDRDFTGQKENRELGLVYYNARFYVPAIGRFLSADTLVPNPANPQSLNRYSYVLNSPLNFTDPTGHKECAETDNCDSGGSSGNNQLNYDRSAKTAKYMYNEMITNAQSQTVADIRALNEAVNYAMESRNGFLMQAAPDQQTAAFGMWFAKVAPRLDWDHKPKLEARLGLKESGDYYFPIMGDSAHEWYYDVWSNLHFGYVGSAAGFDAETLQAGANLAEAGRNDPSDVLSTQIGIDLWSQYGTSLTQAQLVQVVLAHTNDYLTIQAQQPRTYLHRVDVITNGR